jgi:DNA-binding transcriptional regulator YdaS (Cro superfamily)
MNKLARWMEQTGTTRAALAAVIGVDASYVSRLVSADGDQRRMPGLRVALSIERATGGAVPAASWDVSAPKVRPLRPRPA